MMSAIQFPEVLPLALQEERPFGAKFMPNPEFECCEMSPRVSSGPSACSMASSSSVVEGINDYFSFPLAHGSKPTTIAAAHHDLNLLIKQQQSTLRVPGFLEPAEMGYSIPEPFNTRISQLPLVNLDEDLEDALGMLLPQLCDPALDFGGDVSMPLLLHQPSTATAGGLNVPIDTNQSPMMLPIRKADEADVRPTTTSSGGDGQKEKPRRRVGRPRVHASPPPPSAGIATAAEAAASGAAVPTDGGVQKRGRGPKPKYVFATTDEALGARKERNRKAALESYYRKREKTEALNKEIAKLEAENAKLEQLAADIELGAVVLKEASEEGLNAWLAANAQ